MEPGPVTVTNARIVPLTEIDARTADAWRALSERALEPNPYAEAESVLPAARLMDPRSGAAMLLVEHAGDMVFALPVVRRTRLHHVPVSALATWLHPHAYLGTPLVDADVPRVACEAALGMVCRTRPAPRVALPLLPTDGAVRNELDRALRATGRHGTVLEPTTRAVIVRRPTASYVDGRLSARHHRQLRRKRRQLSERIGADVRLVDRAAAGADVHSAVEAFLRLEASGWKGRAGTAMACTPGQAEYFRQMCVNFHRQGRLQLLSLAADGTDLAMHCQVLAGGVAFHVKIAYDEAYRTYSPGLQLELELIDAFHRDPDLRCIDSGSDDPDSVSAKLYPDSRTLETLLIPVHGARGHLASRCTPIVLAAGRRLKHVPRRVADRGAVGTETTAKGAGS